MHEVGVHVAAGGVKGVGVGALLAELVVPGGLEIDGGGQGQHRLRAHLQTLGLLGQQAVGLGVDPVPQGLVILLRPHLAGEGGGKVNLGQGVQGLLAVGDAVAQPQGVAQDGGDHPVVPVVVQPQGVGPFPQGLDGVHLQ